jgi:superoxide dismutase, Fe-Mn family
MKRDRRAFIKTAGMVGTGIILQPIVACSSTSGIIAGMSTEGTAAPTSGGVPFVLPDLGFAFSALEPAIDTLTMEIHHGKHHAAYVSNLNKALDGNAAFSGLDLDAICALVGKDDHAIRNNGGGHWNHSNYWRWIKPGGAVSPSGPLSEAINASFGSKAEFERLFSDAAKTRFGSGWAWLSLGADNKLFISSTPNQDNPLMTNLVERPGKPILGIDVWEHAYYLHYQNRRPDYISSFLGIVNWDEVAADFARYRG